MSLVTTARLTSSRSARQRAATSAVLPLPTGPPMPILTALPARGDTGCSRAPCSWTPEPWSWSRLKESHLRSDMRFGQQVEGRSGRTGQLLERAVRSRGGALGDLVDVAREPGQHGGGEHRIKGEQPHG